jgi:hypothetical protein
MAVTLCAGRSRQQHEEPHGHGHGQCHTKSGSQGEPPGRQAGAVGPRAQRPYRGAMRGDAAHVTDVRHVTYVYRLVLRARVRPRRQRMSHAQVRPIENDRAEAHAVERRTIIASTLSAPGCGVHVRPAAARRLARRRPGPPSSRGGAWARQAAAPHPIRLSTVPSGARGSCARAARSCSVPGYVPLQWTAALTRRSAGGRGWFGVLDERAWPW